MRDYFVGLDLGQAQDPTALIVAHRRQAPAPLPADPKPQDLRRPAMENHYDIAQIRRYPLGTSYPTIVDEVTSRLTKPPYAGNVQLIIDGTGVGRSVVDLFRIPLRVAFPITITASGAPSQDEQGYWRVAKRDLVGTVQVLLQTKRLWIAAQLPEASLLTGELIAFQVKITAAANDVYGAWREGQHDDLVLATALACWAGESKLFGRPFNPVAGGTRLAFPLSRRIQKLGSERRRL
jgi:hypothetical protein